MRTTLMLVSLLMTLAAPAPAQSPPPGPEVFSFYGLRFGMSPEEIRAVVQTNAAATEVAQPGHGMVFLNLAYDYRNRLSAIRASYERPAERLQDTALRQALRERFQLPIAARWRTISVDIDEASNRAALVLVIVSGDMRQNEIEHFKTLYIQRME